jgi:hypothetical protein
MPEPEREPRLCFVCGAPATVEASELRAVSVRAFGSMIRRYTWVDRYLCADHEHVEPPTHERQP